MSYQDSTTSKEKGQARRRLVGGAEQAPGRIGMRLQASLRGCNAEATRCNRAGDTAWAPRCSAGRTAGSAGPRRRNAQLRWAMRGQDPLKEQRVPGSAGLIGDRTRVSELSSLEQ